MTEHSDDVATPTTADVEPPATPAARPAEWIFAVNVGVMQLAGLTSIGAGAIHAGAAGLHAEHPTLARLFVLVAIAQIGVGLLSWIKGGRIAAVLTAALNVGTVAVWTFTRFWGISGISGLEEAEEARFMDGATASLGAIAVVASVIALARSRTSVSTIRLGVPAAAVGAVAVAAMLAGTGHVHTHTDADRSDDDVTVAAGAGVSGGADAAAALAEPAEDDHDHGDGDEGSSDVEAQQALSGGAVAADAVAESASDWPRPWDPAEGIDLSGVEGVTAEQQARAEDLLERTLEELPAFADIETIRLLGYKSIGDAVTGFEHYINYDLINDDVMLDPTQPESLVFAVDGDERELVSAMFLAPKMSVDDPRLTDYAGELMTWHVHDNLCWRGSEDGPKVAGLTDAQGNCPDGTVKAGGENPMVHVWITPHQCGPFAALEGAGAGQASDNVDVCTDQCADHQDHGGGDGDEHADHTHGEGHDDHGEASAEPSARASASASASASAEQAPVPYDPEKPVDLSGTPGVSPDQQAFAENLVAATLHDLPQWSDPEVAEAAGFRSIGDGAAGHEHFIQWDWINDDVWLDPDYPESLVYEPQADGSRKLASAMYMLPESMALEDVPDWGGDLMQWHVHNDLCSEVSGDAPRLGGLTGADGECEAPLEKLGEAPMIHVWITPHECGPFAALEGIGAGQVLEGKEHLCDEAHGSHDHD